MLKEGEATNSLGYFCLFCNKKGVLKKNMKDMEHERCLLRCIFVAKTCVFSVFYLVWVVGVGKDGWLGDGG